MATKKAQATESVAETPTPASRTASATPSLRQPAGNAAATERAGLDGTSAGARLGGDVGEVADWLWGKAEKNLGFGSGDTKDGWDLAKQTAGNIASATKRLEEMGKAARDLGKGEVADTIEGAAKRLAAPAGLATDLKTLIEVKEKIDLVDRVAQTTAAVIDVDLRSAEAAGVFDKWFVTLGEAGEAIADAGGMWGAGLKPFATFVKLFGEHNLFTSVRDDMKMQGWRHQGEPLNGLHEEGF